MLRAPASRSMGAVRGLHMTKVARGVQQPMSEAQTAEYPRRLRLLLTAAGFILSLWLITVLFYYGARDRR